jgi:hypothetical protein
MQDNLLLLLPPHLSCAHLSCCSRHPGLTELALAYKPKPGAAPLKMVAESAAWAGLPLRQLSLQEVEVPAAALQQLAALSPGLSSLELVGCRFECGPCAVAKVLAGEGAAGQV